MRHRVSLRQVEGFLLASELLSFSRASEAMHITQSAFSQLIRELESNLRVQLFDRTTRRVQLTAAGEAMQQKLKRGLESVDDALDEAQAVARVERGHIRVGSLSSLAIGIVTRTLARLRHDFPLITVSMREDFNALLIDDVASGATDLSVCSESGSRPALSFEHLFDDELMVVAKQDTALRRFKVLTWDALASESLVMTARLTSTREHIAASLTAHGISRPVEYEVASMATALAMVRAGFGVTFISRVALRDLQIRGLSALRIRDPATRRMGIYWRTDRSPSPASVKFSELLRAEARRTVMRLR